MAVLKIEEYRQKNGENVLKVVLKPTKVFPKGAYFYCDVSDEKLVEMYIWRLNSQRTPYVVAHFGSSYSCQLLFFHREKTYNIRGYYPDYINHIDGIEYDNVNSNLDEVTSQQNLWCRPTKGYVIARRNFRPLIMVNSRRIWGKCVRTEIEAIQSAYQLEVAYEDYRYEFLKDRRKDTDILDLERTGIISEEEAVYRHVLKYADNAWFYFRYNLAEYFKDNHLTIPKYSLDSQGHMTHSVTGQRLCPL